MGTLCGALDERRWAETGPDEWSRVEAICFLARNHDGPHDYKDMTGVVGVVDEHGVAHRVKGGLYDLHVATGGGLICRPNNEVCVVTEDPTPFAGQHGMVILSPSKVPTSAEARHLLDIWDFGERMKAQRKPRRLKHSAPARKETGV